MANIKQVGIRFDEKQLEHLDAVCNAYGVPRQRLLLSLVEGEYDKMMGNPKLKEMLEQMKRISESMKEMTGDK